MIPLRYETHYGNRVVRCFAQRPAHIDAMFREAVARHPERDALVIGYAGPSDSAWPGALDALCSVLP